MKTKEKSRSEFNASERAETRLIKVMSEKYPSIIFGEFSKKSENLKFQSRRKMPVGSELPPGSYEVRVTEFGFFYELEKQNNPLRFVWDCQILSGEFEKRQIRYSYRMNEINKQILFRNFRIAGLRKDEDLLSILSLPKNLFTNLKFRLSVFCRTAGGVEICQAVFEERLDDGINVSRLLRRWRQKLVVLSPALAWSQSGLDSSLGQYLNGIYFDNKMS